MHTVWYGTRGHGCTYVITPDSERVPTLFAQFVIMARGPRRTPFSSSSPIGSVDGGFQVGRRAFGRLGGHGRGPSRASLWRVLCGGGRKRVTVHSTLTTHRLRCVHQHPGTPNQLNFPAGHVANGVHRTSQGPDETKKKFVARLPHTRRVCTRR